jgi:hypothetical protein
MEALPCTAILSGLNHVALFIEALPFIMPLNVAGGS